MHLQLYTSRQLTANVKNLPLKTGVKATLAYICKQYQGHKDTTILKIETIAKATKKSIRTVHYHLKALAESGLLIITHRYTAWKDRQKQVCNAYTIDRQVFADMLSITYHARETPELQKKVVANNHCIVTPCNGTKKARQTASAVEKAKGAKQRETKREAKRLEQQQEQLRKAQQIKAEMDAPFIEARAKAKAEAQALRDTTAEGPKAVSPEAVELSTEVKKLHPEIAALRALIVSNNNLSNRKQKISFEKETPPGEVRPGRTSPGVRPGRTSPGEVRPFDSSLSLSRLRGFASVFFT